MAYLDVARGEVGYHSTLGDNIVKYWADLQPSFQGSAWCFAFVSWCLWKAGSLGAIGGSPMYYCPTGVSRAQSLGQWFNQPEVGALVFYDWGTGVAGHVEYVTGFTGSSLNTIGGNTSGITNDCVAAKTRPRDRTVMGFWHLNAVPGTGGGTGGTGTGGTAVNSGGELLTVAAPYQDGILTTPVMTLDGEHGDPPGVRFSHGATWVAGR